jgi:ubiquinone/menaquinone biosynthesis C-methylase UbiE
MLLNHVERALMNNPVRAAIQRHYEARKLRHLGGRVNGGHVLEVGCGRGVGTELLLDGFGVASVDAFDLDPKMVERARTRLSAHGSRVKLWVGDVTAIEAEDETYDAVFDFGIIHHVLDWRRALAEIHRVLAPGGRFFAEEVLRRFILHPVSRRFLDHPVTDRFDRDGFALALEQTGLEMVATDALGDYFAWFIAKKPASG